MWAISHLERIMTKPLVPEQFAEIARLSDQTRAEDDLSVTAESNPKLTEQVQAQFDKECLGGTPRQALYENLSALSDESFKELMGWVLFGRDYTPREGDPSVVLGQYISDAIIYPRDIQESYLEAKPIGEYLRDAMKHLLTTTSKDIERAQKDECETGEEEGDE
jgi:hypothetical protein